MCHLAMLLSLNADPDRPTRACRVSGKTQLLVFALLLQCHYNPRKARVLQREFIQLAELKRTTRVRMKDGYWQQTQRSRQVLNAPYFSISNGETPRASVSIASEYEAFGYNAMFYPVA